MERVEPPLPPPDASPDPQSLLEKLTRASAIALSRRQFLGRSVVTGIAALGLSVWGFTPSALAAACNTCYGPCVNGLCGATSCGGECCSPNGAWCSTGGCCTCGSPNCPCANFKFGYVICDDGGWGTVCPMC